MVSGASCQGGEMKQARESLMPKLEHVENVTGQLGVGVAQSLPSLLITLQALLGKERAGRTLLS